MRQLRPRSCCCCSSDVLPPIMAPIFTVSVTPLATSTSNPAGCCRARPDGPMFCILRLSKLDGPIWPPMFGGGGIFDRLVILGGRLGVDRGWAIRQAEATEVARKDDGKSCHAWRRMVSKIFWGRSLLRQCGPPEAPPQSLCESGRSARPAKGADWRAVVPAKVSRAEPSAFRSAVPRLPTRALSRVCTGHANPFAHHMGSRSWASRRVMTSMSFWLSGRFRSSNEQQRGNTAILGTAWSLRLRRDLRRLLLSLSHCSTRRGFQLTNEEHSKKRGEFTQAESECLVRPHPHK